MSRKLLVVLISIVLILLAITGWLFFLLRKAPSENDSAFTKKVREIFPFGQPARNPDDLFGGENKNNNEGNTNTTSGTQNNKVPTLRKIYEYPTSGSTLFSVLNDKKEKNYFIRFVDRATGHVSEALPYSLNISKISNTTLTKNYEALFANENTFLGRFLDNTNDELIKTYSILLKDKIRTASTSTTTSITSTPKESVGTYLDEGMREVVVSPKGDRIAYLLYENDGGSIIVSSNNGLNKRKIYTSPLREWLLSWVKDDSIILSSKPSGLSLGFAYSLNPNSGAISKIISNVVGLTILSNKNQSEFLIGQGGDSFNLYSLKKTPSGDQTLFLTKTLPEKCVWSKQESSIVYCAVPTSIPNGIYPDYWYQGRVSFTDALWKINTTTATTQIISVPKRDVGEDVDAINLQITDDDSYLTFINKKDLSLWGLILKPKKEEIISTTTPKTNP